MSTSARSFLFHSIAAAVLLAGCAGGGETGTGATSKTELPTPVAVGTITNFGSVFVNGVEFFTSGSAFVVDGQSEDESKLKIGMVVSVRGSVNADGKTGAATHIEFADDAEGVVLSNSIIGAVRTLDVMGRTVTVDSATVFDSHDQTTFPTVDSIPVGAIVEVSGFSATGGNITATRIELKKTAFSIGEIETKGIVGSVDSVEKTFDLGSLTVSFATAQLHGLTEASLANQPYVEVKSTQPIAGKRLIASSIKAEKDHKRINGKRGENAKLEGVITHVDPSRGRITVNGQVVSGVPTSVLIGLLAGQKLEVEGDFDEDGILALKKDIRKRESASLEITAKIEATNALESTIAVLGQTFKINVSTILKDDCERCGGQVRQFSVRSLAVGNQVELKAYRLEDGNWIISKLERTNDEGDTARIEGRVESVNGRLVVIGGISVTLPDTAASPTVGENLELEVIRANGLVTTADAKTEISDD